MIIITIIKIFFAFIIGGLLYVYGAFAVTKKLFRKRILSYTLSGATALVIYFLMLFNADETSKDMGISTTLIRICLIICMIIAILITLAFVIGEKKALSSGKHTGDFEKARGARKFNPFSIKKLFKKYPYPFLKDKGILNNIEFEPNSPYVNTNSTEYKQEVFSKKASLHLLHGVFILTWYCIIMGAWLWYFMGYGVYWMVVALIDTFKELYTHEGSKFSFKSAIFEIANSDELTNGVNAVKNSVQSAVSEVENSISEISQKASSAISEHRKEKHDIKDNRNAAIQNENSVPTSPDDDSIQTVSNYEDEGISQSIIEEIQKASFNSSTESDFANKQTENISDFKDITYNDSVQTVSNYKNESISQSIIEEIQKASFNSNMENNFTKQAANHETAISSAPVSENITPNQYEQPENISSPAPTVILPHNQGYVTQKTNPILIVIIIVLVLVIGVLGGMFFMMNRDKPAVSENSFPANENSSVSDIAETMDSEETSTESEIQTPTAENTTAVTITKQPEKNQKTLTAYPESDISKYPQYIKAAEKAASSEGYLNMLLSDISDGYFALIDINSDNIPEFFLTDSSRNIYGVYTLINDTAVELSTVGGGGRDGIALYNDGYISHGGSNGASSGGETYYEYNGNNELTMIQKINYEFTDNGAVYESTIGNKTSEITKEEYEKIPASHGGEASISVSSLAHYVSKKPTISAYIEEKSYYPIADGIDFILHTSGDYSYYHYEGYYTGGGVYDSKCANDDTSESEVLITAGSTISSVKVVVTPYNANDVAGETITVDYTVTLSQPSVKVYSCNAIGQINAPGGGSINGYATSYIVDKGAVSYIRTDLMDNWHVTAVRYCIVNGITWYELYDSDDGDYYGWVDEDHIDFANYVTQEPGISDKYTTYDTSAATADFNFNDNQFGYGGTVVTENDPLNLRAAPSSNSEVIIQMPKGANVFIFGYNNDWYYVCYTENGITYYGYASCQFIAVSDI